MIEPRQFDQLRPWNSICHVSACAKIDRTVVQAVGDQGRDPYRGKNVPNIDFGIHPIEGSHSRGACAHSEQPSPPLTKLLISGHAWRTLIEADRAPPTRFEPGLSKLGSRRRPPRVVRP